LISQRFFDYASLISGISGPSKMDIIPCAF